MIWGLKGTEPPVLYWRECGEGNSAATQVQVQSRRRENQAGCKWQVSAGLGIGACSWERWGLEMVMVAEVGGLLCRRGAVVDVGVERKKGSKRTEKTIGLQQLGR